MAQNPTSGPNGNGDDDDGESVITSAREPVSATAITGEMPAVRVGDFVNDAALDDTDTQLPTFDPDDFGTNAFDGSEATGPIAFQVTQALLRGETKITPEQAAAILAPAREGAIVALEKLVEDLGGSVTANLAATLLGITEEELRQSGLIILANDEVPMFQIRKGKKLAGIVEVANAFREVNPKDVESVMLLDFLACPLRELAGRSPVQALKAAHELVSQAGGDTSQSVKKIAELARQYPQGDMIALDEQLNLRP